MIAPHAADRRSAILAQNIYLQGLQAEIYVYETGKEKYSEARRGI